MKMKMRAQNGWSIVRRGGTRPWHAYRRYSPAPKELENDTFSTRRGAEEECRRRNAALGYGRVLGEATGY